MKKFVIFFIFYLVTHSFVFADNTEEIKQVNKKAAQIEKTKDKLNILELKLHTSELEAAPPEVMFYYEADNMELVMLQVNVGHEIFTTKHTYYFNNNCVIKYLKESFNHPDSPPKKAIIYNDKGKPLWQNINAPIIKPAEIKKQFERNVDLLIAFSKY
jgi:hypothetical protein